MANNIISGEEQRVLTNEVVDIVRNTMIGLRNDGQRLFAAGVMIDESTKISNAIMDRVK